MDQPSKQLLQAIKEENFELIKHLINTGANANFANSEGITPLLLAIDHNDLLFVEYLIQTAHVNVNLRNHYNGKTPLLSALYQKMFEPDRDILHLVQYLVQSGADVNQAESSSVTPLFLAVLLNDLKIVEYLVQVSGVQLNPKGHNDQGKTPLILAVEKNELPLVQCLVKAGAEIDLRHRGITPLLLGVHKGHHTIVEYLVEKGGNVNVQDLEGNTPLILAIRLNDFSFFSFVDNFAMIKCLIGAQANLFAKNQAGDTALSIAAIQAKQEGAVGFPGRTTLSYLQAYKVRVFLDQLRRVNPTIQLQQGSPKESTLKNPTELPEILYALLRLKYHSFLVPARILLGAQHQSTPNNHIKKLPNELMDHLLWILFQHTLNEPEHYIKGLSYETEPATHIDHLSVDALQKVCATHWQFVRSIGTTQVTQSLSDHQSIAPAQ